MYCFAHDFRCPHLYHLTIFYCPFGCGCHILYIRPFHTTQIPGELPGHCRGILVQSFHTTNEIPGNSFFPGNVQPCSGVGLKDKTPGFCVEQGFELGWLRETTAHIPGKYRPRNYSVNGRWGVGGVKKKPGISREFISRGLAVQCERAFTHLEESRCPSLPVGNCASEPVLVRCPMLLT